MLGSDVERSDAEALSEAQAVLAAARRTARTSNLISAVGLLFSGCALAVSLSVGSSSSYAGARLAGETPALKALQPETHYVRLEELAIYQDQIVEGAVGTAELADGSVTKEKLAAGAVTGGSLADGSVGFAALEAGTIAMIAAEVTNTRTIVGEVHEDATWRGSGFTVERVRGEDGSAVYGEYILKFNMAFAEPPVVVPVANSYGVCYCPASKTSTQTVEVHCMSDLLTAAPIHTDMGFNFYAGVSPMP